MNAKGRLLQLADGSVVEEDVLHVVERIQDYDPRLVIKYLNPDNPNSVGDAPWAVFELCPDGIERLVFTTWKLDMSIMERLWDADTTKHNILTNLDKNNSSIQNEQKRKYRERNAEVVDVISHMLKAPGTTYSFELDGKHITVDDTPKSKAKVKVKD